MTEAKKDPMELSAGKALSEKPKGNLNKQTAAAINEFCEMKKHPERYRRYSSFEDAMKDVFREF